MDRTTADLESVAPYFLTIISNCEEVETVLHYGNDAMDALLESSTEMTWMISMKTILTNLLSSGSSTRETVETLLNSLKRLDEDMTDFARADIDFQE
jgi:hypothetical protein